MEAFDDLVTEEGTPVEQDWQDFGDHVRAEEDRKARVLSSIQSAMRERLDSSVALTELNVNEGDDSKSMNPSEDLREQLFEGIPDPYPHSTKFQRVIISESGEDIDADTVKSCKVLNTCMGLREKWLGDCTPPPSKERGAAAGLASPVAREGGAADGGKGFRRRPGSVYNIFDREVPASSGDYSYMMVRGVFEVRKIRSGEGDGGEDCVARSFEHFIEDFITVSLDCLFVLCENQLYTFVVIKLSSGENCDTCWKCEVFCIQASGAFVREVQPARAAERREGERRHQVRAPSRLLQRAQGGHARAPQRLHEPEAPVALHQEQAPQQLRRGGCVSRRQISHFGRSF
jgi:hypothetical protein